MLISERVLDAEARLRGMRVPDPAGDAAALMNHVLGRPWSDVRGRELPGGAVLRFEHLLEERMRRVPLAYLVGETTFYRRTWKVERDLFIPRRGTETVARVAVDVAHRTRAPRVVDVGCGTGVLGLTVAAEIPWCEVILSDVDERACACARENAFRHGIDSSRVHVERAPFLGAAETWSGTVGLVVSNPPYLTADERDAFPAWEQHEPRSTMVPPGIRLDFFRQLAHGAAAVLAGGGHLVVEVGPLGEVRTAVEEAGLRVVQVAADHSSADRVLVAERPPRS